MKYTVPPKPAPRGESPLTNDDLAHHIGNLARDVANLRDEIKLLQIAEQTRVHEERAGIHRRAAFWWKLAFFGIGLFLIPTISAFWQAARLIERMDNISTQVKNVTADHEVRLRQIERRHSDSMPQLPQ